MLRSFPIFETYGTVTELSVGIIINFVGARGSVVG
jgi:hypothetical protein